MARDTTEAEYDFRSYLNTALEAAHRNRPTKYWLEQARAAAVELGWERHMERYHTVVLECVDIAMGPWDEEEAR